MDYVLQSERHIDVMECTIKKMFKCHQALLLELTIELCIITHLCYVIMYDDHVLVEVDAMKVC